MELVAMLRVLWRHRMLVVVAALIAVLVGLTVAYRVGLPPKLESRQYTVGVASLTALVDTPSSQVVDLGGKTGADIGTLSARASLLASLMTSSPIKDEIASRAGVAPDRLIAVSPAAAPGAGGRGDAAAAGPPAKTNDPKAIILRAKIPNLESGDVPIISVTTQAPDADHARRLANESIAVLQAHLKTVAGIDKVPDARRVVVRQLGQARAATVSRGPAKIMGLVAVVVVFGFGCLAILGIFALVNGWRRAAELEPGEDDEPYVYDEAAETDDAWFGHRRGLPRPTARDENGDDPAADVIGFRGARGS
jgi:capsular polysaccharide biosynthesis protein